VTKFRYDNAGRRKEVEDALGKITKYTYDANANLLAMLDANNHLTTFEYDLNNRRTKTIFHDTTFAITEYDELGRRIVEIDQAGKRTEFKYDKLSRLVEVKDALDNVTAYTYNEVGQQIRQTDAGNRITTYEYDKLGRRTKRTLPLSQFEIYTYDNAGNLFTRADFNGRITTFEYDQLNRLKRKIPDPFFVAQGHQVIRFDYNANGRREKMYDNSGITTYTYDNRDRLISKVTPVGTLTYTYDDASNLKTVRSANTNGVSVDYSYDTLNRVSSVLDNRRNKITTYAYDNVGNLQSYIYGNGVRTMHTFDALYRLTNLTSATGDALSSFTYTLGAAGNRTNVAELSVADIRKPIHTVGLHFHPVRNVQLRTIFWYTKRTRLLAAAAFDDKRASGAASVR
jgi:YD repeat-containing protein